MSKSYTSGRGAQVKMDENQQSDAGSEGESIGRNLEPVWPPAVDAWGPYVPPVNKNAGRATDYGSASGQLSLFRGDVHRQSRGH